MKKLIVFMAAAFIMTASASACIADIGTATTDVYVRSLATGEVVGSLAKGDRVYVSGKHNGWYNVCIGDHEYKVYGDYMDVDPCSADDAEVMTRVRKSRSKGNTDANGVKGKKKSKKIKGSVFEGLAFW